MWKYQEQQRSGTLDTDAFLVVLEYPRETERDKLTREPRSLYTPKINDPRKAKDNFSH